MTQSTMCSTLESVNTIPLDEKTVEDVMMAMMEAGLSFDDNGEIPYTKEGFLSNFEHMTVAKKDEFKCIFFRVKDTNAPHIDDNMSILDNIDWDAEYVNVFVVLDDNSFTSIDFIEELDIEEWLSTTDIADLIPSFTSADHIKAKILADTYGYAGLNSLICEQHNNSLKTL